MTRYTFSKYAAFFRVAVARARQDRAEIAGRMLFFAVILGVFSSLWRAVAGSGIAATADPRALVWYLAATEWILLSAPMIHLDIQEAVRRGDVISQLGRPVSYTGSTFVEGLGMLAVRAPFLGLTAYVCAFAFTGWTPSFGAVARVVPLGFVGSALITALYLLVGLLAFWMSDILPVWWVWQKLMFVLGGLMLPLELYPDFIRKMARFTPFPAALAGPASLVLDFARVDAGALLRDLVMWSSIVTLAIWTLFRRVTSTLTVNGG
jgi:ABC-2 type transport system permease protein